MKITCPNCDGVFEHDAATCPYCGYINVAGAEQAYLEDLDEIIDDFDQVANHPKEQLKQEATASTKKLVKVFLIATIVVASLILIGKTVLSVADQPYKSTEDQTAQLLWEKETFPKLDAWYEEGDYAAISQFFDEVFASDNDYYFGGWPHTEFIFHYNQYMSFQSVKERGEQGVPYTGYEIATLLINALEEKSPNFALFLAEEDIPLARAYAQEQYDYLISHISYTEEQLTELYDNAMEGERFTVDSLYDEGNAKEAELYD